MGTELDHKNIDMLIESPEYGELKIQIKKVTHRPEIARRQENQKDEDNIYPLWYIVPQLRHYLSSPYYLIGERKGELRDSLAEFIKFNKSGSLDMLPIGFVVFTPAAFAQLVTAHASVK